MLPELLLSLVGKRVTGIARVLYCYLGELRPDDGAVELTMDDCTVLIDGGSDGDSLVVSEGPWCDPFAGPLSEENEAYVRTHGKWTHVDCASVEPYAELVGQEITQIHPVMNRWGQLAGVRISWATRTMWITIGADECHVAWALPVDYTEATEADMALRTRTGGGSPRVGGDCWDGTRDHDWDIDSASVEDLDGALARLNARTYTMVTIDRADGQHLVIGGGDGRYVVYASLANEQLWNLHRPVTADGTVRINIGGQAGDYPASQVMDLEQARLAGRTFLLTGTLDPSLRWER